MIGETYGDEQMIASYLNNGMMECQFDFNLFFTTRDAILKDYEGSFVDVAKTMESSFYWYGHHNTMGYISGNHDQPRFMGYAGGDLKFGENDREAGFSRDIVVKDSLGYKKLQSMMGFIFTIPGVPVVYYGDEIGMVGANDPDNRDLMRFSGLNAWEEDTKSITQKLTALRSGSMPLIYGDTEILKAEKDVLIYARTYFDEVVIIAFNRNRRAKDVSVELPAHLVKTFRQQFGQEFTLEDNKLTIKMGGYGFEMLM